MVFVCACVCVRELCVYVCCCFKYLKWKRDFLIVQFIILTRSPQSMIYHLVLNRSEGVEQEELSRDDAGGINWLTFWHYLPKLKRIIRASEMHTYIH